MNAKQVRGTFYVQLQAVRWQANRDVAGVKAVRMTQSKPHSVEPDAIVIKVNANVPAAAFDLLPTVDVTIPIEHVGIPEVESDAYPVATDDDSA